MDRSITSAPRPMMFRTFPFMKPPYSDLIFSQRPMPRKSVRTFTERPCRCVLPSRARLSGPVIDRAHQMSQDSIGYPATTMNRVKLFAYSPATNELATLIQHFGEVDLRSGAFLSFERVSDTG